MGAVTEKASVTLGINNVLDQDPPLSTGTRTLPAPSRWSRPMRARSLVAAVRSAQEGQGDSARSAVEVIRKPFHG